MNKNVKIVLISIVVLLVAILLTVSVFLWIIFTPEKLTPIANKTIQEYLTCEFKSTETELTFFSTFPRFCVKIKDFCLINPVKGSDSDTLLTVKNVVAAIDIKTLWKYNELKISAVMFDSPRLKAFVDASDKSNFDIVKADSSSNDSSGFYNSFAKIDLSDLVFRNANITYTDLASNILLKISNLNFASGLSVKDGILKAKVKSLSKGVCLRVDSIDYFDKVVIRFDSPLEYNFSENAFRFKNSLLKINGLTAGINGDVIYHSNTKEFFTRLDFKAAEFMLKNLLDLLPGEYTSMMDGVKINGKIALKGSVNGIYSDSSMPVFKLILNFNSGKAEYVGFPLQFNDLTGNAVVDLDLNNTDNSKINFGQISAKTLSSEFSGKIQMNKILSDNMELGFDMRMKLMLSEFEKLIPESYKVQLNGWSDGHFKAFFTYNDFVNLKLQNMKILAGLNAEKLMIRYDTITMNADKAKVEFRMPGQSDRKLNFLNAVLISDHLLVQQGSDTQISIKNPQIKAFFPEVLSMNKANTFNLEIETENLSAGQSGLKAFLNNAKASIKTTVNFNDSLSVPYLFCDFNSSKAIVHQDSIDVVIGQPAAKIGMRTDKTHFNRQIIDIDYVSNSLDLVRAGQEVMAKDLIFKSVLTQNKNEKLALLQWMPAGYFSMKKAGIKLNGLNANVKIPDLQLNFNKDTFWVSNTKLIVDNSDFEFKGKLWDFTKYLKNEDLLKGDFALTSNVTDVHRIMELTNGFGVADSTSVPTNTSMQATNSSSVYIVPKQLDIHLHTKIDSVLLGFDYAKNVLGDVYVKDGVLACENLRFTTPAARMQLSALYKTPRKNHLFVGLDFHIMDMEVAELLKMIPDVDTIMPMLRSFGGKGEFHIAAETYLDSSYHIKKSTLRGVSSIKGENLVLMDGQTFSEIAKKLRFNKKTENKVDSLSAEFTIFKNEVDIYPFLIVMDKYKAVVAGRHNLDMSFDYHISVVDSPLPFRLGVDVKGTLEKMKILPVKCRYANLYRPSQRREIDTKQLEIRKMIRDALTKNVVQ